MQIDANPTIQHIPLIPSQVHQTIHTTLTGLFQLDIDSYLTQPSRYSIILSAARTALCLRGTQEMVWVYQYAASIWLPVC